VREAWSVIHRADRRPRARTRPRGWVPGRRSVSSRSRDVSL